jgi:hypothetical protein
LEYEKVEMHFPQSVSDTPTLKISILFTNLAAGKGIGSDWTRGEGRQGEVTKRRRAKWRSHNPKRFNKAQ